MRIEDGMKYDPISLKTMFKLCGKSERGKDGLPHPSLILDVCDCSGSTPHTVIRYLLQKAKKYEIDVKMILRFNLEKIIDTKEICDVVKPYEAIIKYMVIKVPICFYINQRMIISKKFQYLKDQFRHIEYLAFKSTEVVQFLPEEILSSQHTKLQKVKLSFESINGLISVQNITNARIFKLKYNFPNTKRLEQPYSLNDFQNIEEFSIKFKKQNPQGKSAFALEQILAPTRGLRKLKITIREEEISIRKFLPKQVLRNWNVVNYILSLDNMTLQVPLKEEKFVTQFDPAETIASFI